VTYCNVNEKGIHERAVLLCSVSSSCSKATEYVFNFTLRIVLVLIIHISDISCSFLGKSVF